MKKKLAYTMSLILATACGIDADRDKAENGQNPDDQGTRTADDVVFIDNDAEQAGTLALIVDEELAGQAISSQIDVAVSGAVESPEMSTGAMLLADLGREGEIRHLRQCTESAGMAIVEIENVFTRHFEAGGLIRSYTHDVNFQGQTKRTWSRAEGEIACHEDGKWAEVPVNDMSGVALGIEFDRAKSRSASFENKATGLKLERSFAWAAQGTRSVVWTDVVVENGSIYLNKQVESNVHRKLQVRNRKGEERLIEMDIATRSDDPVMVETIRDQATLAKRSRTIQSGTLDGKRADGGRIEVSFNNVKYSVGQCMAESGVINGAIYEADDEEPKLTFDISFDGQSKKIVFSDGREYEYTPEGCDFEIEDDE